MAYILVRHTLWYSLVNSSGVILIHPIRRLCIRNQIHPVGDSYTLVVSYTVALHHDSFVHPDGIYTLGCAIHPDCV